MSPIQVLLVFVGIPALVIAVVFGLVYGLSSRRTGERSLPVLDRPALPPDGRAGEPDAGGRG